MSEITELLEKARHILRTQSEIHRPEPLVKPTWKCIESADYTELEIVVDQALTLSKQQPKDYPTRTIENTEVCTCGNIFVEDDDYDSGGSESGVICPDCGNEKFQTVKDLLKQQPPAGEFTKKIRHNLKVHGRAGDTHRLGNIYAKWLKEACDRLDRAEARLKAMYAGDLSPENRLSGYKVVTDQLKIRIDELKASKADLLALCEEFMEKADDGSAEFDDPVPGSIFLRAEAAIAKAKEEG